MGHEGWNSLLNRTWSNKTSFFFFQYLRITCQKFRFFGCYKLLNWCYLRSRTNNDLEDCQICRWEIKRSWIWNLPFREMKRKLSLSKLQFEELSFDLNYTFVLFILWNRSWKQAKIDGQNIKYTLAVIEWQIRMPCFAIFGTRIEMTDTNSINNGYIASSSLNS